MRRNRTLTLAVVAVIALVAGCGTSVGGDAIAATSIATAAPTAPTELAPTVQSTTEEPTTEEPTTEEPTTEEPTTEPSTEEPTEPSTTEPSTTESSPTAASSSAASPTAKKKWTLPDTKPGRKKNAYGDLIAKPGEANGVTFDVSGKPAGELIFVISKLTVDPKCVAGAPKSRRGHLLRIDIEVEPRDLTPEATDLWSQTFRAAAWTAFDAKGTAQTGIDTDEADECLATGEELPFIDSAFLKAGKLAKGAVMLDVASPKGTVVLDLSLDGGWEFHYG